MWYEYGTFSLGVSVALIHLLNQLWFTHVEHTWNSNFCYLIGNRVYGKLVKNAMVNT